MKNAALVLLFMSISLHLYSQVVDYSRFSGIKVKSNFTVRLETPYFKSYGAPGFQEYVKINLFNATSFAEGPESIVWALYTANSDQALKRLFKQGSKIELRSFKRPSRAIDTARNFLVLRHKLTFNMSEGELSIIKYTQFADSLAVSDFAIQVLRTNERFQGVKLDEYRDIEFALLNISAEEFWALHRREQQQPNKIISETVLSQVKDEEGVLNLSKLSDIIQERVRQGKKNFLD
jgi:hypothetical protein